MNFLHLVQIYLEIQVLRIDDCSCEDDDLKSPERHTSMNAGTSQNFGQVEKDPALLIYPVLVLSHISGVLKPHFLLFLYVSCWKMNRLWLSMLSLWEWLSL